jgi:hypothetical protein
MAKIIVFIGLEYVQQANELSVAIPLEPFRDLSIVSEGVLVWQTYLCGLFPSPPRRHSSAGSSAASTI